MRELKSAVVTGPTGAIGTALCRILTQNGIKVYAITHPGSRRTDHLHEIDGVQIISCDATEYHRLPNDIASADAFFHLSWRETTGSGRNDMPAQISNIRYTIDACRVAYRLGCKVFIGAGSQAEYGRVNEPLRPDTPCFPENGYGMAKLCAGQMSKIECEKFGIDHIWPRILSVYGPHDGENALIPTLIRKLLRGESMALTAGEQMWDYLYAEDASIALYKVAINGKNGAVYPVGYGHARPLKDYIKIIRNMIDPYLPLGFGEIPYSEKQVMHLEADLTALKTDTGFVPKMEFEKGIRETIEAIKRQYGE